MSKDFPTPLIIFAAKTGDEVRETSRMRTDETGWYFWAVFQQNLEFASSADPDEVIVRFLRPVKE